MSNKKKIVTIFVVFIVTLSIFFCVQKTLAIYRNGASGTISTDLAEWSVTVAQESQSNELNLVSGVTNQSYSLSVRNISEVDISYSIVISNLPSGVEISLDNGAFQTQTNNSITFNDVGSILYNDVSKQKTHVLEFKSNAGSAEVSNQQISIAVIAKQIL